MLFNSLQYLLFLPLVAALYWRAPAKLRLPVLLIASYLFYMSWMKIYGLLLFGLTAVNFIFGLLVHRTEGKSARRLVFIAGLTVNLFCLALFKYTNFLLDSFKDFAAILHNWQLLPVSPTCLHDLPIILPLGISFFAFEFIHYLSDIFKGDKPIFSPLKFALFAAFFPSQIAGPIKRYQDFEKQEVADARFDPELFRSGVMLFAQGMFKKVALGDNLAPIVQVGFANPQLMSTCDAWACVFAFSLQIYYDFSGYTDLAIGSARILGFNLPPNFNMPYLATSLREFWHRWHISLSTWLRDYLYIPLGGSRQGKSKAMLNLITTMLLGGLWHGASWHFVLWGAFHGLGLAFNRVWDDWIAKVSFLEKASKSWTWEMGSRLIIFVFVSLAWVVFRAKNIPEAFAVYQGMFSPHASMTPEATISEMIWQSSLPFAFSLYLLVYFGNHFYKKWEPFLPETLRAFNMPIYTRAVLLLGFAVLVVGLAPHAAIPFIYFQF